jgi:ferredoxin-type protein NapF
MHQRILKTIRVILALLFLSATGFIFLDFRELLTPGMISGITFLQFLPSVLHFFTSFGIVATGFVVVLLLTALLGRIYCSTVCPLGILQDVISWIRKKTRRKFRYRFGKPQNRWRYGFLVLPFLVLLAGKSLIGFTLLDPYSIFGRITSDLFQPVYMWLNNRIAGILAGMDVYVLYPENISPASVFTYVLPSLMLALVVWFSFTRGRLYCNTVCPVGTILGLLSRVSLFRIRMVEDLCTKCGKCAIACKASCIRVKTLEVDFSRCVGCYNCIAVCPEDAIQYLRTPFIANSRSRIPRTDHAGPVDPSRRKALESMASTGLALSGLSFLTVNPSPERLSSSGHSGLGHPAIGQDTVAATRPPANVENKIPTEIEPVKHFPVSPPGSMGIRHFTTRCTACHLCVSVCPTSVLQPSLKEYGWPGHMQPHMDYSTNYCNFECKLCSEVCPTGAILSLSAETKKTTQLGQVHLILENCVVYAENTACGSCSEHCPTQAVTMVPYREGLTLPEIKPEICVGCGACEYACPVRPFKAIYVDGHQIHQVAEKPEIKELEQPDLEEEFPF